jgi:Beta-propeller repeat
MDNNRNFFEQWICIIVFCIILLQLPIARADDPYPKLWTRQFSFNTSSVENTKGLDTDYLGNIYVSGSTTHAPSLQAFIRKYDASGNLIWSTHFGTPLEDYSTALATMSNGTSFVSGSTRRGAGQDYDVFVSKFDVNGQEI